MFIGLFMAIHLLLVHVGPHVKKQDAAIRSGARAATSTTSEGSWQEEETNRKNKVGKWLTKDGVLMDIMIVIGSVIPQM